MSILGVKGPIPKRTASFCAAGSTDMYFREHMVESMASNDTLFFWGQVSYEAPFPQLTFFGNQKSTNNI